MSLHSVSSEHENGTSGHNTLQNGVERTTDITPVVSSSDALYDKVNHATDIAPARLPSPDRSDSILWTKKVYPMLLERTMSMCSVFTQYDNNSSEALPEEMDNVTRSPPILWVYLEAIIAAIARKTALAIIIFMIAFSVNDDSRLLRLTDHLVFAMESGVHLFISTYLSQRGIEEREVLRCMGAGGTVLYALAFLRTSRVLVADSSDVAIAFGYNNGTLGVGDSARAGAGADEAGSSRGETGLGAEGAGVGSRGGAGAGADGTGTGLGVVGGGIGSEGRAGIDSRGGGGGEREGGGEGGRAGAENGH
ncbi:hypothetical protein C8R48DRAFT_676677 [Suillus tomentosus]|nr:hypothetical protein C8R48DRAFT_676677 [Suillus tomentosus]